VSKHYCVKRRFSKLLHNAELLSPVTVRSIYFSHSIMLHSSVLVIMVSTSLLLVSTSRMRLVMYTAIYHLKVGPKPPECMYMHVLIITNIRIIGGLVEHKASTKPHSLFHFHTVVH